MKHYEDLVWRLRRGTGLPVLQALMNEAASAIEDLQAQLDKYAPLKCACEWCGHWSPDGCLQAHNCEDFEWPKKEDKDG